MFSLTQKVSPHSLETSQHSADDTSCETNLEDITIVWFDQYMNEVDNQKDVNRTKGLLRQTNNYVIFFTKPDLCIDYLKSNTKGKLFLIISGSYALEHLNKIHPLKQVDSVYIFCLMREKYQHLQTKYSKVIDVFTVQEDLIESLVVNVELVTKQPDVFALFDCKQRPTRHLTRESGAFVWFQFLTDVIKIMAIADKNNTGIAEMLVYCKAYYRANRIELKNIEEFRNIYQPKDAIFWYSKQSFVYRLVNVALRTEDVDALYTFRIFITHLRNQIAEEHQRLCEASHQSKTCIIHLYRGFKMTHKELSQMRDSIGSFISMNGFFSTSRNIQQAILFAQKKSKRENVFGVLLEIDVDITVETTKFADIAQFSAFPEEQEVLFDLSTVFKIVHVEFDKGRDLWIIQLSGISEFYRSFLVFQ